MMRVENREEIVPTSGRAAAAQSVAEAARLFVVHTNAELVRLGLPEAVMGYDEADMTVDIARSHNGRLRIYVHTAHYDDEYVEIRPEWLDDPDAYIGNELDDAVARTAERMARLQEQLTAASTYMSSLAASQRDYKIKNKHKKN